MFNDENIAANRNWLLELLHALTPLNITWISSGGLSVRSVNDDELLAQMVTSGIGLFNLAIESGSDATLARINKKLTVEEICRAIARIRAYTDAYIIGFFIIGFPFESWADIQNTIHFARSLDLDWKSFYCFQPFPGSKSYDYCIENNLLSSFNPDYGQIYFASNLKYVDYTSVQLSHLAYESNLDINFINNRNLKLNTSDSLRQAQKDFEYVLKIVPDHIVAINGLAEIARMQHNFQKQELYVSKAVNLLQTNTGEWHQYPAITDALHVNKNAIKNNLTFKNE